jgi:hypothetical protein
MPEVDKRNILDDEVFTYQEGKDNKVFIFWHGKQVKILKGKAAQKFMATIAGLEHKDAQLVMAKATGNFKRGNERSGKQN